jgi:hypothetical protein
MRRAGCWCLYREWKENKNVKYSLDVVTSDHLSILCSLLCVRICKLNFAAYVNFLPGPIDASKHVTFRNATPVKIIHKEVWPLMNEWPFICDSKYYLCINDGCWINFCCYNIKHFNFLYNIWIYHKENVVKNLHLYIKVNIFA